MPKVAVYGTLKKGYENHHLLGEDPLFAGFVEIPFKMFAHEYFPWLLPSEKKHKIFLEVYEVSDDKMELLDQIEGGAGYHREKIKFPRLEDRVYIYIGNEGMQGERVKNGKF